MSKAKRNKKSAERVDVDLFYLNHPIFTVYYYIGLIDVLPSKTRQGFIREKRTDTFSSTHLFLNCGQLYILLSLIHSFSSTTFFIDFQSLRIFSSILPFLSLIYTSHLNDSLLKCLFHTDFDIQFLNISLHCFKLLFTSEIYIGIIYLINLPDISFIYSCLILDSCHT